MKNLLLKSLGATVVVAAIVGVKLWPGEAAPTATPASQYKAAPALTGTSWLNSKPINLVSRRGKVTVVEFWTFACSNCQANLPAYAKWARDFKSKGVEVIGVHTPELAQERDPKNVTRFVKEHGITYPVLIDGNGANWKRWKTKYWPTIYLIDKQGNIRSNWEGELGPKGAAQIATRINALLAESAVSTTPPAKIEKITKTDAEWKAQLSPEAYDVLRHEGTEAAGTSPLVNNHENGTFICAGCNLPLFSSKTKFESGTGWPSFYQPLNKNVVVEKTDSSYGMSRTEVECARCGGHLGHVFDDGPKPTGLRYCMNGISLKFVKSGK